MISDEAVEAAAIAMSECGAEGWEDQGEHFKGVMRRDARLALEAAAPHMHDKAAESRLLAIAWSEAYSAGFQEGAGYGHTPNPYRRPRA